MLRHRLWSARLAKSVEQGKLHAQPLSQHQPRRIIGGLAPFSVPTRWNSDSSRGKRGAYKTRGSALAAALQESTVSSHQQEIPRPKTELPDDSPTTPTRGATANSEPPKAPTKSTKVASRTTKAAAKATKTAEKTTDDSTKTTKNSKGRRKRKSKADLNIQTIRPTQLKLEAVKEDTPETARLSHGLDRILFNPGVYHLADPRTGVYNFDPYLASIMPVDQFDFDALKEFVSSSEDSKLRGMSNAHGKKYCGSTSSMTAIMSHFHYLLSGWRPLSFDNLSQSMKPLSTNFTKFQRGPASVHAILKDGVYAFDADKQYNKETVLSMMGKSMEKLLTLPKEEFEKYRRTRSHLLSEEEKNADEAFHYTTLGDFMMRSQQDAYDPRLPGTGTFDLKTRAVISVRMDMKDDKSTGYEIRQRFGEWNSFEREYHDMIRAAFLKYSLQVRMGRMDGVFVAFHNTQRIFGFQYVSLEEMDLALHGSDSRSVGDQEFKASLALLNDLMDRATERFPGRSLRLLVETRPTAIPLTYFFVEPVTEEDIRHSKEESQRTVEEIGHTIKDELQEAASASHLIDQAQPSSNEATRGIDEQTDGDEKDETESEQAWEQMMAKIEETVELESLGLQSVRQAFQDVLEPSSEEELDALMHDIEYITAASPGMRELNEASVSDLDGTTGNGAGPQTDQGSEELTSAESEEIARTAYAPDMKGLGDEAVKLDPDVTIEKTVDPETYLGLSQASDGSMSSHPEEIDALVRSPDDVQKETEIIDGGLEADQSTSPSAHQEREDALRRLIAQVTEGMGDQEGSRLRALIARIAARAKPAFTSQAVMAGDDATPTEAEGETAAAEDVASTATQESATALAKDHLQEPKELLGMYVTVQNHVDNKHVERVYLGSTTDGNERAEPKWKVEYSVVELDDDEARRIYAQMHRRRKQLHLEASNNKSDDKDRFLKTVAKMAEEGARYRLQLDRELEGKPVHVAWGEDTLPPEVRNSGVTGDIFNKEDGAAVEK